MTSRTLDELRASTSGKMSSASSYKDPDLPSRKRMHVRRQRRGPQEEGMRHPQTGQRSSLEFDDTTDTLAFLSSSSSSSSATGIAVPRLQLSVRGAGSSFYAAQDSGNYQMLHDECLDLCSTILASTCPYRITEATVQLAFTLSNPKTRSVIWQGDPALDAESSRTAREANLAFTIDVDKINSPNRRGGRASTTRTALQAILDVLGAVTTSLNTSGATDVPINLKIQASKGRNRAFCVKPIAATNRVVNNARINKKKQAVPVAMLSKMRQALASMAYFLSLDCTMSENQSVACQGTVRAPSVARKMRRTILKHVTALQGTMRLALTDTSSSVQDSSSVSGTNDANSVKTHVSNPSPTSRYRSKAFGRLSGTAVTKDVLFNSPANTSKSSSLSEESSSSSFRQPNKELFMDPTAKGRLNRLKKRQRLDAMQAIPEDELDFIEFSAAPQSPTAASPLRKRVATSARSLSFTSNSGTHIMESSTAGLSSPHKPKGTDGSLPSSPSQFSTTSGSQNVSADCETKLVQVLERVRVALGMQEGPGRSCGDGDISVNTKNHENFWVASVALESINRIVTGKEEGSVSCLDGVEVDVDEHDEDLVIDEERHNPIIMTNQFLFKSGIIPLMARSMSQSLSAVMHLLCSLEDGPICSGTLSFLHHKTSMLSSLIDGACLWNDDNRSAFCEGDPFSFDQRDKGLIFYLLLLLKRLNAPVLQDNARWYHASDVDVEHLRDIVHATLRTLMSLTHENVSAAEQVVARSKEDEHFDDEASFCGVELLAEIVYQLQSDLIIPARRRKKKPAVVVHEDDDKTRYDSTIFCLNTLANVVEIGDARTIMANMRLPSDDDEMWIRWLCQWVLNRTEGFHDALLGTGNSADQDLTTSSRNSSDSDFTSQESEGLNAAGNGCVLLAYLMTESDHQEDSESSSDAVLEMVVDEMPPYTDGTPSGVSLIRSTLNAFCNLYKCSVGELGDAIITPVRLLIGKLKEIEKRPLQSSK
jgi:hypothetical protein